MIVEQVESESGLVVDVIEGGGGGGGGVGPQGPPGVPGTAATVNVGTTVTGAPGTDAIVTQSGTEQARILNFTIPQGVSGTPGATGSPGATGERGEQGIAGRTPQFITVPDRETAIAESLANPSDIFVWED